MKSELARPNWEDVVFASRNKEYGAYAIRKSYDENIAKASLIMILFASFVFGALQVASLMHVEIKIPHPHLPILISEPPPKIIVEPAKRIEVKPRQLNRKLLVRVVKHEITPTPQKPDEPSTPGTEVGTNTSLSVNGTVATVGNEVTSVVAAPPKTVDFAEVMPEYEGGMSAMMKFLRKNLNYPASARRTTTEGTVFVRFVVNSEGDVTDVEVVRGVSAVLDKEATRVIALMKKWKPGLQHKMPVSVRMILPIRFKLEE